MVDVESDEIAVLETADQIKTERNAAVSTLESLTDAVRETSIGANLLAETY